MAVQYRAGKYLDELWETTSFGTDNHFGEVNLKQLHEASKSMMSDMCRVFGVEGAKDLNPEKLSKPSVVKAQMAEWLHTAVFLLDQCCFPVMSNARSQLDELQKEKIEDQTEIIRLQKRLISQKNEELGLVSKTVETKLKSYSSVLQQSCSAALSPKKIAAAVQSATKEDDRSKEVVMFGVPEEQEECTTSKVTKVLEELDEKPQISKCRRIGQKTIGSVRPVIFTVRNSDIVYQILRKAKGLRDIEGYKTVYISPNRTAEERIERRKLVSELKSKRSGDPNSCYFIRKGEIVKAENSNV